jgi:hypothetical protein
MNKKTFFYSMLLAVCTGLTAFSLTQNLAFAVGAGTCSISFCLFLGVLINTREK